jgi:pyruvate formate lyase activating enzyme
MRHLPPTPSATLLRAREIARSRGIQFVYIGNMMLPDASTTFCPACEKQLIRRTGYYVNENHLEDGKCDGCGAEIYGVWQ